MFSKNAAAFGVEALIGKKRLRDFDAFEVSRTESKHSSNKLRKTDQPQGNCGNEPEVVSSPPSSGNVKIKSENLEKGSADDSSFQSEYLLSSTVKHGTELMKKQRGLSRISNYRFQEGEKAKDYRPNPSQSESCHCSGGRILSSSGISLQLLNHELWAQFHQHQTEMIITKNGRRMFPVMKIRIFGLDPDANYLLYLDNVLLDDKRYRYAYPNSRWIVSGTGEPLGHNHVFIHPDSPATGKQWMDAPLISFDKLKLTNNKTTEAKGQLFFHSMQKYVPRIWVQKLTGPEIPPKSESEDGLIQLEFLINRDQAVKFAFGETSFITVTAYQNQQITRLKINSNPFAKGFRENTKHKDSTICMKPSASPDLNSKMALGINDTFHSRNLYRCRLPSLLAHRIPPIYFDPPLLSYDPCSSTEPFYPYRTCNPPLTTSLVPSSYSYSTLLMPSTVFQKKLQHQYQSYAQSQLRTFPLLFSNVNAGILPLPPSIIPRLQSNSMNRDVFFNSVTSNSFRMLPNRQESCVKGEKIKK